MDDFERSGCCTLLCDDQFPRDLAVSRDRFRRVQRVVDKTYEVVRVFDNSRNFMIEEQFDDLFEVSGVWTEADGAAACGRLPILRGIPAGSTGPWFEKISRW